jgi:hypothetical protein
MVGYDVKPITEYETPELVTQSLQSAMVAQHELILHVNARSELSYSDLRALQPGQPLILHPGMAMHSFDFSVFEGESFESQPRLLGYVVNAYQTMGVADIEFNKALFAVIVDNLVLEHYDEIPLTFLGLSPNNRNHLLAAFPRRGKE